VSASRRGPRRPASRRATPVTGVQVPKLLPPAQARLGNRPLVGGLIPSSESASGAGPARPASTADPAADGDLAPDAGPTADGDRAPDAGPTADDDRAPDAGLAGDGLAPGVGDAVGGGLAPAAGCESDGLATSVGPAARGDLVLGVGPAVGGGLVPRVGPAAGGGLVPRVGPAAGGGLVLTGGSAARGGVVPGVGLAAPGGLATTVAFASGLHPVELAGLLHELSVGMLSADDVHHALDRLAVFAAGAVSGVLRCSVTLIADGEPLTRAVSGPEAQPLDDLQYAVGQGPGLDAARTRALVTAQDLPTDPRWPDLAHCARAQAVHSVAAIPLDVQRSSVGSLSLFVGRAHGIGPDLLLTAMAIVNQAEVLLAELDRREASSEGATVDRAVGVIIAQRGCGVREAYDVLQETALRLGMDRRAVAERLVTAAARNAGPP